MNTYVAFLRGINVGGRVVKMADLKACFEQLGFNNIRTISVLARPQRHDFGHPVGQTTHQSAL